MPRTWQYDCRLAIGVNLYLQIANAAFFTRHPFHKLDLERLQRLPPAACDRAETKPKGKKTAAFNFLTVSLQH